MKSCDSSATVVQRLAVVDDVDLGQVPLDQLGVLAAQLVGLHPVDVAHSGVGRHRQRLVQRADLQAVAAEEAGRQSRPGVEVRGGRWGRGRRGLGSALAPVERAHRLQATCQLTRTARCG